MTIALLMGSFNPVHEGHLAIARYVIRQGLADRVWFVVSPQNPLKDPYDLAPFDERLEMVRLAIADTGRRYPALAGSFEVCDIEAALPRPSYTIDTILELKNRYPAERFIILAGSDIESQLSRWKSIGELRETVQFLFYPRDNGAASPGMENAPQYTIDATAIRSDIAAGRAVSPDVLPAPVYDYIRHQELYTMRRNLSHLDSAITQEPGIAENYYQRGRLHYQNNDFGKAMNDFNKTLEIDPCHSPARQMREMTEAIFSFRNFDIYNP